MGWRRRTTARKGNRNVRNGVAASIVVLLALVMAAIGVGGGFLLTRSRIPPSLVSSTAATTVKVASTPFDDSRSVTLNVALGQSSTVTSPVSGTVTRISIRAGGVLKSGQAAFDVNAQPMLALHTSVPPYRSLTSGMRGTDAAALNAALRRLGQGAPDSDRMTWDTITAYNAIARSVGARQLSGDSGWAIDPGWFVWLPADSVTVKQVSVAVGRQIDAGQDLFVTSATAVKATLPNSVADIVSGRRKLTIDKQEFDVPDGTVELTDPAVLAAIDGSTAFRMASLGGDSATASGTGSATGGDGSAGGGTVSVPYSWRLTRPLTALTVPPSAIYDVVAGKGCVSVDGKPTPVRIIASQLGKTMVSVDGKTMAFDHVDVIPRTAEHCSAQGGE
ncbi:hypothetical protein [Bifidobacterium catulorum]|uniref:hypothetical protein n=1 Tax=Bifidobacterium catulorum TaxID=1630173 RepID=UPI0011B20145|nr:hypothetical protein [Bifidobacterium catulorum]